MRYTPVTARTPTSIPGGTMLTHEVSRVVRYCTTTPERPSATAVTCPAAVTDAPELIDSYDTESDDNWFPARSITRAPTFHAVPRDTSVSRTTSVNCAG